MKTGHYYYYCAMMLCVSCELTAIDETEVDVFENSACLLQIIYAHSLLKVLQLGNVFGILAMRLVLFLDRH